MALWLCGYVGKGLTGGTAAQVAGEPPARPQLTDLSSELLEPQGKPGWGTTIFISVLIGNIHPLLFKNSPRKSRIGIGEGVCQYTLLIHTASGAEIGCRGGNRYVDW